MAPIKKQKRNKTQSKNSFSINNTGSDVGKQCARRLQTSEQTTQGGHTPPHTRTKEGLAGHPTQGAENAWWGVRQPQRSSLLTICCWGARQSPSWKALHPQAPGRGTGAAAATVKMQDKKGNETLWGKFCFIICRPGF